MIPETMIVGARAFDAEIMRLTRPTWEPFVKRIIILTPEDEPIAGADIIYGKAQHFGPLSIQRMRRALEIATEYPSIILTEPDVMLFGPIDVQEDELVGSYVCINTDPRFKAPTYPHAPWVATGRTFGKLLAEMDGINEDGFGDRVVALAALRAGVTLRGVGYSRNAIDTPQILAEAVAAVNAGALAVHGIKDKQVADSLKMGSVRPALPLGY